MRIKVESDGTLVENFVEPADPTKQHAGLRDYIAEAEELVQNILGTKMNNNVANNEHSQHNHEGSSKQRTVESIEESRSCNPRPANTNGSVLASLMKLDNLRRQAFLAKMKHAKMRKLQKNKLRDPASAHNLKIDSSSEMHDPSTSTDKRATSRPNSWLSNLTTSQHVVPSLQKKKMANANSMSRRTSIDSLYTTSSQFDALTFDDRIRITFEIAGILQRQEFLRKLVKALMLYGAPAHRLECIMRQVSSTLGIEAEYVYIPNVMFLTFVDQSTHTTQTHFIRCSQLFDMHKLGEIFRLEKLVSHGEVTVDEALEFIDQVEAEPPFYPAFITPFVYAVASFCGSVMFYGGDFKEGGLSAALAIFFALYELLSGHYLSLQPIWEITVCIFIGFVSRAVWRYGFCFTPVAFASFIIILPGYTITISIIELISRQLVSGVIRMVYAIIYAFLLGYGIEMGSQMFSTIDPESVSAQGVAKACRDASLSNTCRAIISKWFYFLTVPLFAVTYCIFLRARPPRWPVMILVAATGFVVTYALACYTSAPSQVLQVVPAFVVGLLGNVLSKMTGKMHLDAVILGIFYMVPGSLGLKAALGFFGRNEHGEFANQGAGFALSMIETCIGK
ncbi:hypothetical protein G6F57_006067 [Rhizopus arrhizus]|uniref:Threonine/serine exporter-like N-terminal domain-containing protein n=1 Tax=Rhizopus oryzae TaxID=64495 RepID=A0A9P6XA96_RHIOR|nr:hypothetical protein G6F23_005584 [Rhizopus arrhizus]KAG1424595.1 hypothetical protein G6F58_002307 [Rhizopus delemar]KAG0763767.1 hypothetical protein G6F24_005766 [Rhizopus arrhizus]KAG0790358.1 hypothetical protein G6F21_005869 [Rhizopus arrhizus]KAG0799089.1 hypothetical protein G6F22_003576 [Rhizopus arrhizus]